MSRILSALPDWSIRLLREPLVHFLLIGATVFAADAMVVAVRGGEHEIVVPADVLAEARRTFVAAMRREPTTAEQGQLLRRWVDNEVLYREGLALGLDKGDPALRERVIFKSLTVVQAALVMPSIDDTGLRAWFDANRARYDVPGRITFDEAVPAGEPDAAAMQRFVAALNGAGTPELEASLQAFRQRPRDNIVQAYGEDFTVRLERLRPQAWAVVEAGGRPRIVRLHEATAARPATYEEVRDRVYPDWKDDTAARLTTDAVRELGRKYRTRLSEATL